jgi:hypothetical protein
VGEEYRSWSTWLWCLMYSSVTLSLLGPNNIVQYNVAYLCEITYWNNSIDVR